MMAKIVKPIVTNHADLNNSQYALFYRYILQDSFDFKKFYAISPNENRQ